MHRRHTTPAATEQLPFAATRHDLLADSTRPRQASAVRMRALSLPKSGSLSRANLPALMPWDRSLRSSQPIYIAGPGFGRKRRSSSKQAAAAPLPEIRPRAGSAFAALPPPFAPAAPPAPPRDVPRRRSTTHPSLDVSVFVAPEAETRPPAPPAFQREGPRRPSPQPLHLRRDEVAALEAYTSPNAVIFAAYDTLRLLLIPLWRRYRYRKQLRRATATVAKFVLAKVRERRLCRRERAADFLASVLRDPRTQVLSAVRELRSRVVLIQRAFRLHRRSVQAVVELNLRKIRRDAEQPYWAAVVARREEELAAQQPRTSAVAKAVQEVIDARRDIHTRFGTVRRQSILSTSEPSAPAAAPISYELDVYNFYMVGRLPESLLKAEITSAVVAHARRSAQRARLVDELCTPKHQRRGHATRPAGNRPAAPTRVATPPYAVAKLPHFLPTAVYTAVLNNTCYVTSLMRDDAMLRAHLPRGPSHLESY